MVFFWCEACDPVAQNPPSCRKHAYIMEYNACMLCFFRHAWRYYLIFTWSEALFLALQIEALKKGHNPSFCKPRLQCLWYSHLTFIDHFCLRLLLFRTNSHFSSFQIGSFPCWKTSTLFPTEFVSWIKLLLTSFPILQSHLWIMNLIESDCLFSWKLLLLEDLSQVLQNHLIILSPNFFSGFSIFAGSLHFQVCYRCLDSRSFWNCGRLNSFYCVTSIHSIIRVWSS